MRIRLALLGVEVLDFATGDDVLDSYGEAEPRIQAVYGGHAPGADLTPAGRTFGFGPNDEPVPEYYE